MLVPPLNLRGDDRVDARLRLLRRGVYKQWWYYYDGATPTAGLRRNYKFMTTSLAAGDDGGGAARNSPVRSREMESSSTAALR